MLDLPRIARYGRPALRGVSTGTYTFAMLASTRARMRLSSLERRPQVWDESFRRWARGTLRIAGIECAVSDAGPGSPDSGPGGRRGRLIVANHRSILDVLILIRLFGGRFLSREDVARWPVLGRLVVGSGTLFVDRESRSSGAAAIRSIRRHLAAGEAVSVFPEGTTFRGDEVRPFQSGAFAATRGLDVVVTPVGLAYPASVEWAEGSFAEHLREVTSRERTTVGVAIGPSFAPRGAAAAVADEARSAVARLVAEARALVVGGGDAARGGGGAWRG